jgi:hypothetical protein
MDERDAWGSTAAYMQAAVEVELQLRARGQISDSVALDLLEQYLSMPFEDALSSSSPLLRAMAMIDRRHGKRRLRSIRLASDEHPLVRELYAVRCLAEDVESSTPA